MIRAADTFVTDAAVDAIQGADAIGLPTPRELLGVAIKTTLHSRGALARGARLGARARGIATGRSAVQPDPKDWRFKDPAWQDNPAFHRVMQMYLAATAACRAVPQGRGPRVARRRARASSLVSLVLTSALAPTNTLAGNPAALKRAFETGGVSLVRGARNFLTTCGTTAGMPAPVATAFSVGENLAATPGAVVYRDEVSSSSSTPRRRRGPRASGDDRPAADQPLLLHGPRAEAQLRRVRRQPRHPVLHDQLAQPGRRAARLGPRHLRRARPAGHRRRHARSPAATDVNMLGFCAGGSLYVDDAEPPGRAR